MKYVTLSYSTTITEEGILDFARRMGYQGQDIDEAVQNFIHPAFKTHVAPWMTQLLLEKKYDPTVIEVYKAQILGDYKVWENP